VGVGQQQQAGERKTHAGRQGVRLRFAIDIETDHRLQHRGGELKRECQNADLSEVETVITLQHRIDRRQQRLHHVVQQMTDADGRQDGKRRFRGCGVAVTGVGRAHMDAGSFVAEILA
jgi:hypothetical protein